MMSSPTYQEQYYEYKDVNRGEKYKGEG